MSLDYVTRLCRCATTAGWCGRSMLCENRESRPHPSGYLCGVEEWLPLQWGAGSEVQSHPVAAGVARHTWAPNSHGSQAARAHGNQHITRQPCSTSARQSAHYTATAPSIVHPAHHISSQLHQAHPSTVQPITTAPHIVHCSTALRAVTSKY